MFGLDSMQGAFQGGERGDMHRPARAHQLGAERDTLHSPWAVTVVGPVALVGKCAARARSGGADSHGMEHA